MSALTRVERNSRNEVMMPVNVEGLIDNEGLTVKQGIAIFGSLGLLLIDILWFKDKQVATRFLPWLINISIWLIITQFVIRKFALDEAYKMKQIALMDKYVKCVPDLMWDVMSINDNTGIMQFSDGRVAVVVGLEQATIVGRPEDYKDVHYDAISNFLKVLDAGGVRWVRINLMMNAKYDKRLSVLADSIEECNIPAIKEKTTEHLGYLRGVEIRTLYETEYFLIVASPTIGAIKLLNIVSDALDYLDDAAYNQTNILTSEELKNLMAETTVVDTFDTEETMRQLARRNSTIAAVFNIKNIKLNNNLNDEDVNKTIIDGKHVVRDKDYTEIFTTDMDINRIKIELEQTHRKGQFMSKGSIEKCLLGIKSKNNDTVKMPARNKKVQSVDNRVDSIDSEARMFSVAGDTDIVDLEKFTKAEESEAAEVMAELGIEDEFKKAEITNIKARNISESSKIEEEKEEARKVAEISLEERKRAIKEQVELDKKKRVDINDLIE